MKIPDRTAAVWVSGARYAIDRRVEKARGVMNLSQKTCPWIKYRFLRPQERYVLCEICEGSGLPPRSWRVTCLLRDIRAEAGISRLFAVERTSTGTRCSQILRVPGVNERSAVRSRLRFPLSQPFRAGAFFLWAGWQGAYLTGWRVASLRARVECGVWRVELKNA